MPQTGIVALSLFNWPAGTDKTQHKLVLEGEVAIDTVTTTPIAVTAWSITSNVLTLTAVNSLTGGGGDEITVQDFATSTFLNGNYTTTSATGTTIVMAKTHTDGSATEAGQVVLSPEYATGGLEIPYAFTDAQGKSVQVPLGSGAVPNWIQAYSASGGAYNYKVDQTQVPNLLRIYNGVTELSDAAVILADTIYYRAEFNYGMGGSGY